MLFRQFYLESLGHASYLVGSEETGDALVLDPRRDVQVYLDEGRRLGLRLRYAVDTHQHNDYLSGSLELAARTGAEPLTGEHARVRYEARRLKDGEPFALGEVSFRVLHTPGHTPEHISLLAIDHSRGAAPALLLSGGALLVGDVARPDLLGGREEAERAAAVLCETLRARVLSLEDYVEVYPTHVAGSLCGGHLSSRLSTTIGYERRMNPLLAQAQSKTDFVRRCVDLETLPAVPPYWPRMRRANADGPRVLGTLPEPPALPPHEFRRMRESGAVVLDCRSPEAFAGAHIPGALNVGLGPSFPTWAGTVMPAERPYLVLLESEDDLWPACWHLLRIGYDLPEGWLAGGLFAWRTAALPLRTMPAWTVWDLDAARREQQGLVTLDVRQPQEWRHGHIDGAVHITGAELPRRLGDVPADRPVALVCGSGYRSSVSASLLAHHGREHVVNVLGGMSAWTEAGLPVVK